jgi:hypothetical protein
MLFDRMESDTNQFEIPNVQRASRMIRWVDWAVACGAGINQVSGVAGLAQAWSMAYLTEWDVRTTRTECSVPSLTWCEWHNSQLVSRIDLSKRQHYLD